MMVRRRRSGRSFNYRLHQGGWIFQAIQAATAVASLFGASKAKKKAKKAAKAAQAAQTKNLDAQSAALTAQTEIAKTAEGRSADLYNEYMATGLPAQKEVLDMARAPIDPDVEANMAGADFAASDAVAEGVRRRRQQRAGIDPSSGVAAEADRLSLLDSVAGKAGAMTTARRGAAERRLQRIGNAAQQFQGLIGASGGYSSQASAGYGSSASGLSNLAEAYARRADTAAGVAGAAGNQAGESLSDIFGVIKGLWGGKT